MPLQSIRLLLNPAASGLSLQTVASGRRGRSKAAGTDAAVFQHPSGATGEPCGTAGLHHGGMIEIRDPVASAAARFGCLRVVGKHGTGIIGTAPRRRQLQDHIAGRQMHADRTQPDARDRIQNPLHKSGHFRRSKVESGITIPGRDARCQLAITRITRVAATA